MKLLLFISLILFCTLSFGDNLKITTPVSASKPQIESFNAMAESRGVIEAESQDDFILANSSVPTRESTLDPYENFNRNSFRMNQTLDKNFVRPATVWYVSYIPNPVRLGIQNFFNNLRNFVTLGNDILQLSLYRSIKDTGRICINSTIGILGLIDVASHLGMPLYINTFGHTLQFYGWEHSNYYVIPFLGASTVRDAIGIIPDAIFNPLWFFDYPYSNYVSVGFFVANGLDTRSKYLDFDQTLQSAIDQYAAMRDFYLQSTNNLPVTESGNSSDNNTKIDSLLND